MPFFDWLRHLRPAAGRRKKKPAIRRGRPTSPLRVRNLEDRVMMNAAHFDFNPPGNQPRPGATSVAYNDVYTPSQGYGWQTPVSNADLALLNGQPQGGETAQDNTFLLDLPSGGYVVHLRVGEAAGAQDLVDVRVGGNSVLGGQLINPPPGQSATPAFQATVSGQLAVELVDTNGPSGWVLNTLDVQTAPQRQLGQLHHAAVRHADGHAQRLRGRRRRHGLAPDPGRQRLGDGQRRRLLQLLPQCQLHRQ